MTDKTSSVDVKDLLDSLAQINGDLLSSLRRSMAVAGGKVYRDEAIVLAPRKTGRLKSSIYLAYKDGQSTETVDVYSVSWNAKIAPHGHLVEFGHAVVAQKGGPSFGWVPAHPFLRPAFDAASARANGAMLARGRDRFAELLRDLYTPADEDFV